MKKRVSKMKRYMRIFKENIKKVKAPNSKFRTTKDALKFVQTLKWNDIVLNGVYDPESNIAIIEPGDTISEFEPGEWGLQEELILSGIDYKGIKHKDYLKQFKFFYNYNLKDYPRDINIIRKDKAKFTTNDLVNIKAFEEYLVDFLDNEFDDFDHYLTIDGSMGDRKISIKIQRDEEDKSPEDKYGYTLKELQDELISMGKDTAMDWWHDNPTADRNDLNDYINDVVGDMADGIYGKYSLEKNKAEFLKAKGIRDVVGWAANYLADGMEKAKKR